MRGSFAYPEDVLLVNLDAILTVKQAAQWCTMLRDDGKGVTTHTVYGWIRRYGLVKRDGGYRYGDILGAEKKARTNDVGAGRGRPKAA